MSFVVSGQLRVAAENVDRFTKIIGQHARNSLKLEPGCLAFEVAQDRQDPGLFLLYEVYRDEDAYFEHRKTDSYMWFYRHGGPLIEVQSDGARIIARRDLRRADR